MDDLFKGTLDVWGPKAWTYLHLLTMYYTPAEKIDMQNRLDRFFNSIPCGYCALNAKQYIQKHPIDYTSAYSIQKWAVDFHNYKNRELNKPQFRFEDLMITYGHLMNRINVITNVTTVPN